jgi:uncharacterized protein (DUF1800 family)
MKKNSMRSTRIRGRLDAAGAGFLTTLLLASLTLAVPYAQAGKKKKKAQGEDQQAQLSKSFKGGLPISDLKEDEAILHALDRLAYGPRPGEMERVRQMGLEKWINQQLDPDSINDSPMQARLADLTTLKMSSSKLLSEFPPPAQEAKKEGLTKEQFQEERREKARVEMQQTKESDDGDPAKMQLARMQGPRRIIGELSMAKVDRAIYSERQLYEVMANFWFNHFNVFARKGADLWMLTSYERDTIRPRAMGKFQDLLEATAKSPAMLFYLDNWQSADPIAWQNSQQQMAGRRMRYRGIFGSMVPPPPQQFPNGSNSPQGGGQGQAKKQERGLNENYGREIMELHTLGVDGGYSQQDVIQVAKCFTGWTIRQPRRDAEFYFNDRIHAQGPKYVLGKKIDSGGMKDGEQVLKLLAHHPSTANFISTELARHFVSDVPPASLVSRMAQTFTSSDGDIRAVLRAMIYSPEFWSRAAYRAKVKTPFELAVSTARALNADVTVSLPLVQWIARMGEPLYLCQPPTGYSDKAETWVNTGALLNRLNFALALASNRVSGATTDVALLFGPEADTDPQKALSRAMESFFGGQASAQTRETLEKRMNDPQILQAQLDDPVKHVNQGLIAGLVLGAPEFQRR